MGSRKDLKTYKEDSCASCKEQGWPNKKRGRSCCLTYPTKVTSYYNKKVKVESETDLYKLHETDSQDQIDVYLKKTGRTIKKDDFFNWSVKRGICPYGVISSNTRYWLELLSVYDGEMGLNTPLDYKELPAIFFDVLRIYRDSKPVETLKVNDAK